MKNLLYIFLVVITSIFSTNCSSKRDQFVIGVSQPKDDPWRLKMTKEILQEALFYDNLDVEVAYAGREEDRHGKPELQIKQIEQYIKDGVDLLIISPTDSEKIVPVVEKAMDLGIPVIIVDRKIDTDKYTAYIGVDNYDIGYKASQYAVNALKGRGNIIDVGGANRMPSSQERHRGFVDGIKDYKDIKILSSVDPMWDKDMSQHAVDSLLRIYPDVDLIFAYNDLMAHGAYEAARALGREKQIEIIGVNSLISEESNGIDWISKGYIGATVLYSTDGSLVIETANDILKRKAFTKETNAETTLIDSLNVRITMIQLQQIEELDNRIQSLNVRITDHIHINSEQRRLLFIISVLSILLLVVVITIAKTLRSKSRMNSRLECQNQEILEQKNQLEELSQKLTEATQAKLKFFTNISHDLRTPLTLISDPINLIMEDESLSGHQRSLLKTVTKNIDVLLRLIEQIVDFRRIENGKTKLTLTNINLLDSINEWTSSFMPKIEQSNKRIVLHAISNFDYSINVDKLKMERVFYNLLSNAVKYSYQETIIHIELSALSRETGDYIVMKIINNCNPNVKEYINNVFERFYTSNEYSEGSGIGLAITKNYVEVHGGEISAEYVDQSSQFQMTVLLPLNRTIQTDTDTSMNISEIYDNSPMEDVSNEIDLSIDGAAEKMLILVVDDNEDIRKYICDQLNDEYKTIEASDGLMGFDMAKRYIPDLVISDIMMPVMDGLDLCKEIKQELITRHIPVLMLTACIEDEQRLTGYQRGADGYITKPFSFKMLRTRVKNLIDNRGLITPKSDNDSNKIQLRDDISSQEEQFIEHLNQFLEENYANINLNIDNIAEAMCYSRVQLFRKVKALCGESPNQLLKNLRLRKADQLLRTTKKSVAEISYIVGFSSPSYFSKNYRDLYGVSPRDTASTTPTEK